MNQKHMRFRFEGFLPSGSVKFGLTQHREHRQMREWGSLFAEQRRFVNKRQEQLVLLGGDRDVHLSRDSAVQQIRTLVGGIIGETLARSQEELDRLVVARRLARLEAQAADAEAISRTFDERISRLEAVVGAPPEEAVEESSVGVPTLEELLSQEAIRSAVEAISHLADRVFNGHSGEPSLEVADDPVLGGIHLIVDVPVTGLEGADYMERRSELDTRVCETVDPEVLGRIVLTTTYIEDA